MRALICMVLSFFIFQIMGEGNLLLASAVTYLVCIVAHYHYKKRNGIEERWNIKDDSNFSAVFLCVVNLIAFTEFGEPVIVLLTLVLFCFPMLLFIRFLGTTDIQEPL